jgi:hypothetical protein
MLAAPSQSRQWLTAIAIAWLIATAYLLLHHWTGLAQQFGSTDDALRLVMLREFLAGKGWYDHSLVRLDPPFGTEMHWSSLIDAGLAALFRLCAVLVGPFRGELATRALWPVLWLLPVIAASGCAALKISGREAGLVAIAYGAVALPGFLQFAPGRIDHHNVQIALALTAVAAAMWSEGNSRLAALAGILCGLMLAVGLESLPYVGILAATFSLRFIFQPAGVVEFRSFHAAIAASATLAFVSSVPPGRWSVGLCDQVAFNTALPVVAGALVAAGSSVFPASLMSRGHRAVWVGTSALTALALFAITDPVCLAGPFARVDPVVKSLWLDHVQEALPVLDALKTREHAAVAGMLAIPLAGCIATVILLIGRRTLPSFAELLLFAALLTSLLATFYAVRTLSFAVWFAIPVTAAAVVQLWQRLTIVDPIVRTVLLAVLSPLLLSGAAVAVAQGPRPAVAATLLTGPGTACTAMASYRLLRDLPQGRVMAFIDLGPHVLLHTHHGVIAGPYHRLPRGIIDSYRFFSAPEHEAGRVLRERQVDYVIFCLRSATPRFGRPLGPEAMWSRLARRELPNWLEPVPQSMAGPVQIFRVVR